MNKERRTTMYVSIKMFFKLFETKQKFFSFRFDMTSIECNIIYFRKHLRYIILYIF